MWYSLGFAALYGLLGIVLSALGYKLFDLVETKVDFAEELRKGNVAAAIVVAAFLISLGLIIAATVGS